MNNLNPKFFSPLAVVAMLLLFSSCKKERQVVPTVNTHTVKEMNAALYSTSHGIELLNYILNQANSHKNNDEQVPLFPDACTQVVTIDLGGGLTQAILDFGTTGCTDAKGVHYRGKVTVAYNSPDISIPNTEFRVQYYNLTMGDITLQGKMIMKNLGIGTSGNPTGFVKSSLIINDQMAGLNYFQMSDLMVENPGYENWITGSVEIKDDPHSSTHTLHTIIKKLEEPYTTCSYIVSGIVETQRTGQPLEILDYGDGTCDDLATLTIDGVSTVISGKN